MKKIDVSGQMPKGAASRKQWSQETFKRVSVVPRFSLSGVSDQDMLRRYVDLPKLFDLIKNKRLVMPALGELIKGDPFECTAVKNLDSLSREELINQAVALEIYAPATARQSKFVMPPQLLPIPSWAEEDSFASDLQNLGEEVLKDTVRYLERERLKHDLVCSCWHSAAFESDAMWKIYASQLGVTINSSVARIKAGVKMIVPKVYSDSAELEIAAVHYGNGEKCESAEPWLIKRKAFSHEREVRLFCDVPFVYGDQFALEVDLTTLIEEIVITPFVAPWQVAGIKAAVESLLMSVGSGAISVRQSKHMRAPHMPWPPDANAKNVDVKNSVSWPLVGDLY